MEITIYYGDVMSDNIRDLFTKHTGIELVADFNEKTEKKGKKNTQSTAFGEYFGGDDKTEEEMRADFKDVGRRFHKVYADGWFTLNDMINAAAFFDAICPKKKQCWKVSHCYQSEIITPKYYTLKDKYIKMVKSGKIKL